MGYYLVIPTGPEFAAADIADECEWVEVRNPLTLALGAEMAKAKFCADRGWLEEDVKILVVPIAVVPETPDGVGIRVRHVI